MGMIRNFADRAILWKYGMGLLLSCIMLPVAGAVEYPAEKSMDSVLAAVNGEPVILSEILPETRRNEALAMATSDSEEELQEKIIALRKAAVDALIERKLILQAYERNPLPLDEQFVENYLDEMIAANGMTSRKDFVRKLRENNMTLDEVRKGIREQVIIAAMTSIYCQREVNITPKALYEYYVQHPDEFGTPEKWRLQLLLVLPENEKNLPILAEALKQQNPDFTQLIELYSDAPNRENGGDLGLLLPGDLRKEFQAVLGDDPEEGKVYGPFALNPGVAYLRLVERQKARTISFQEVMKSLREQLEQQEREEALKKYVQELRSEAIIEYYF